MEATIQRVSSIVVETSKDEQHFSKIPLPLRYFGFLSATNFKIEPKSYNINGINFFYIFLYATNNINSKKDDLSIIQRSSFLMLQA